MQGRLGSLEEEDTTLVEWVLGVGVRFKEWLSGISRVKVVQQVGTYYQVRSLREVAW